VAAHLLKSEESVMCKITRFKFWILLLLRKVACRIGFDVIYFCGECGADWDYLHGRCTTNCAERGNL